MANNGRRALQFENFEEVIADVQALNANGYEKLGQWDLSQICDHLATWIAFSMDGFPRAPFSMRSLLWILRHTVGRRELDRVLRSGQMPDGAPTFRSSVALPARDAGPAIKRLQQAIQRFEGHTGPWCVSPLYGPMTAVQWHQMHLIHCSHHLNYLHSR